MTEEEAKAISNYKGNPNIEKITDIEEKSKYISNAVEFFEPITQDMVPGILPNRYYISSKGNTLNANTLKPIGLSMHRKGYKQFAAITKDEEGKSKQYTRKLHKYVIEIFKPLTDEAKNGEGSPYQVDHINGNKLNNDIANLDYVTASENTIRAINNGQKTVFGNNYKVNLTREQVAIIKEMSCCSVADIRYAIGNPSKEIVSDSTIRLIKDGHNRKAEL